MLRYLALIIILPLFGEITPPFQTGYIERGGHKIYYEQRGNPKGVPVVVLHGGPGTGCTPSLAEPIDPDFYRIVMFDQRGCGRSSPRGETQCNTTADLIEDLEAIRKLCQIDKWIVYGGGWGTIYAQQYGKQHPERCLAFVLRGVHTAQPGRAIRVMRRLQAFYPDEFARLLPEDVEDENLMSSLKEKLNETPVESAIILGLVMFKGAFVRPAPDMEERLREIPQICLEISQLWWHYASNDYFLTENLLAPSAHFQLPCHIVQGRLDLICTPGEAWRLHQKWPGSKLHLVPDTGCASSEPGNVKALGEAFNALKPVVARKAAN